MSPSEVPYPRLERNADGVPIINIGPYGGMATAAAMAYAYLPLPKQWPADWPEDGVISMDDPRVAAACDPLAPSQAAERALLYYQTRRLEGE